MRRMLRILFNMAWLASLVLCLGVLVLWVRSYFVMDLIERNSAVPAERLFLKRAVCSRAGRILCARHIIFATDQSGGRIPSRTPPQTFSHRASLPPPDWDAFIATRFGSRLVAAVGWHGYDDAKMESSGPMRLAGVDGGFSIPVGGALYNHTGFLSIPHWSLAAAFLLLPAIALQSRWKRRRRSNAPPGRCATCGYDLRATPDRCPECGAAFVSKTGLAREGLSETEGV